MIIFAAFAKLRNQHWFELNIHYYVGAICAVFDLKSKTPAFGNTIGTSLPGMMGSLHADAHRSVG